MPLPHVNRREFESFMNLSLVAPCCTWNSQVFQKIKCPSNPGYSERIILKKIYFDIFCHFHFKIVFFFQSRSFQRDRFSIVENVLYIGTRNIVNATLLLYNNIIFSRPDTIKKNEIVIYQRQHFSENNVHRSIGFHVFY